MSRGKFWGQINHNFFILIFNSLQSEQRRARFSGEKYNVLNFLKCVRDYSSDYAKELVGVAQYKAARRKPQKFVFIFRGSDDAVIREFGTQKIRQVLKVSITASAYTPGDGRIK